MPRQRRYPCDTTDAQWAVIDRLLPDPAWLAGAGGRPEVHCHRDVVDAIFYLVDNGTKWQALPSDFPPWPTVYNYLATWDKAGVTQDVLDGLRDRLRLGEGRTAQPSAAEIDSASVKAAETVGAASRGYDAGKKINGRKRHIAVWADGGYAGKLLAWAREHCKVVLEIVKRSDDVKGFVVLPRRWVVERTLAWIAGHRRCVRDYERLPEHHEAMVRWTVIRITSRRLAKHDWV